MFYDGTKILEIFLIAFFSLELCIKLPKIAKLDNRRVLNGTCKSIRLPFCMEHRLNIFLEITIAVFDSNVYRRIQFVLNNVHILRMI